MRGGGDRGVEGRGGAGGGGGIGGVQLAYARVFVNGYKSSKYSRNSQDLSRLNFDEEVVKVRRAFVVSGLVESKIEEDFQDASIRRRCSCNYETSLLESSLKIRRRKRN
uniref:Uncharacterized protein n=1 Tax=Vespula pensylvanica TaxID=30213 RepID=A0A834N2X3_VESPE|nr:hypothetical protein H0235_016947 [Vespula pensylvanica]